jgi:hypothetical protein
MQTENLVFTKHALERMERRIISKEMIRRTLSNPDITVPGHNPKKDNQVKFIKTINSRRLHVVATLLPDRKWLIISSWVKGEQDKLPLTWLILSFPFKVAFKISLWLLKFTLKMSWSMLKSFFRNLVGPKSKKRLHKNVNQ